MSVASLGINYDCSIIMNDKEVVNVKGFQIAESIVMPYLIQKLKWPKERINMNLKMRNCLLISLSFMHQINFVMVVP